MNQEQEPVEEKVEGGGAFMPSFLLNALNQIPFQPSPEPHGSSWQIEEGEATLEDGSVKKVYFAVETVIQGNKIQVYWYTLPDLQSRLNMGMRALAKLTQLEQAANPLLVANQQQMKNVVEEAKRTGLIIPGR